MKINRSLLKGLVLSSSLLSTPAMSAGIYVIRHGQADNNTQGFFNGSPKNKGYREAHLTETGKEQVHASGKKLAALGLSEKNVQAVYISPLPRTRQTAEIIEAELAIPATKNKLTEAIIEVNPGKFEGTSHKDFPWGKHDHSHAHEYGGETPEDVRARVRTFLAGVLKSADRKSNVVIVSHGDPCGEMIEYLSGTAPKEMLKNAEFVAISWDQIKADKGE